MYAGKEVFFFNCSNFTSEGYLIHLKTKLSKSEICHSDCQSPSVLLRQSVHIQSMPSEEKDDLCFNNSGFYIIILIIYTNK